MSSLEEVKGLLPTSLFGGILSERNYVALTLIFIEQFCAVFAPVVTRLISFVQVLVYPGGDMDSSNDTINSDFSDEVTPKSGGEKIPIVSKSYARFIDDKKPTVGTKSDIKKLEDFGFDKYRFLSKSFMKRNKIVREKD